MTKKIDERLTDVLWRIENLYYIYTKDSELIPFKLNKYQRRILLDILEEREKGNKLIQLLILKCRQIGITTFFLIFNLDQALFNRGKNCALIAQGEEEMGEMFEKINVAWENFDKRISPIKVVQKTSTKYKFAHDSSIRVTLSTRGGTVNNLHISEIAKIGKKFPKREKEIQTGALQSVPKTNSIIVFESTAEGADGYFYDLVQDAIDGKNSYKFYFFPWWEEEDYQLEAPADFEFTEEEQQLRQIVFQKFQYWITKNQMTWYRWKKEDLKENISQEFPSYIEEAFLSTGNPFYDLNIVRQYSFVNPYKDSVIKGLDWYLPNEEYDKGRFQTYEDYMKDYISNRNDLIVGGDVAEGLETGDFSVIRVRNRNGDLIASYRGHIKPDELTKVIDRLYEMGMRNAVIGVERNNHGHAFFAASKNKVWEYMLFVERSVDKISKKPLQKMGWLTTGISRPLMLDEHEEAIRKGWLDMDKILQSEILTFFNINGKPQAANKKHDDVIMADAICLQMKKERPITEFML